MLLIMENVDVTRVHYSNQQYFWEDSFTHPHSKNPFYIEVWSTLMHLIKYYIQLSCIRFDVVTTSGLNRYSFSVEVTPSWDCDAGLPSKLLTPTPTPPTIDGRGSVVLMAVADVDVEGTTVIAWWLSGLSVD